MVNYLRNQNILYTVFFNNQLCIKILNNVTVLLKPVHAVRQCIDKGVISKNDKFQTIGFLPSTSSSLNRFTLSNNRYVPL